MVGGVRDPRLDPQSSSASSKSIDFLIAACCISSFKNALKGNESKIPPPEWPFLLKCSDKFFRWAAKRLLSKNLAGVADPGVRARPPKLLGVGGGARGDSEVLPLLKTGGAKLGGVADAWL